MNKRQHAIDILERSVPCVPKLFFDKLNKHEKGVDFALRYLYNSEEETNAGDLARALDVSTARVAILLDKMEKKGLIYRYSSKADARKTIIVLSKKGRDLELKKREAIIRIVERLIDDLGLEKLESFVNTSLEINTSLKEILEEGKIEIE